MLKQRADDFLLDFDQPVLSSSATRSLPPGPILSVASTFNCWDLLPDKAGVNIEAELLLQKC